MPRADQAKSGDTTRYGTTVESREDGGAGHTVLNTRDTSGQQLGEIWPSDEEIS